MGSARIRFPPELEGLLRSELEICIMEANLGDTDTVIAQKYLLSQIAMIDIAEELGWTRGAVSGHIDRITARVAETSARLGLRKSYTIET